MLELLTLIDSRASHGKSWKEQGTSTVPQSTKCRFSFKKNEPGTFKGGRAREANTLFLVRHWRHHVAVHTVLIGSEVLQARGFVETYQDNEPGTFKGKL